MKTFKLGLVIGRFQHIHNSHERMIRTALTSCERVLLMVGSSQESGTKRNPFSLYTRMNLIRKIFHKEIVEGRLLLSHIDDLTHEDDHSTEWGDFLLAKVDSWKAHYAIQDELDCFIYGNDEERTSWFRPESIEKVSHITLSRYDGLNATKLREYLKNNHSYEWQEQVSPLIRNEYKALREELLHIERFSNGIERFQDIMEGLGL